jgi:hypothetical protein
LFQDSLQWEETALTCLYEVHTRTINISATNQVFVFVAKRIISKTGLHKTFVAGTTACVHKQHNAGETAGT